MANKQEYLIMKLLSSVIIIIMVIITKEMKNRQKMREKIGVTTTKPGCCWLPFIF